MKKTFGKELKHGALAPTLSAQERFLTQMVEKHETVAIFLASGIKLEAEVSSFDDHVICIKGSTVGIVYKRAVSTIQPVASRDFKNQVEERMVSQKTVVVMRPKRTVVKRAFTEIEDRVPNRRR